MKTFSSCWAASGGTRRRAPTTFSWRFATAWCELGERHVGEAMHWLLAYGLIHYVGGYHQMALFLPG
jgi:hypothetical protein